MDEKGVGKLINKIGQKVGAATGGGTILTGVSTYMDVLPALMGCIASGAGIVLSIAVIYCTLAKGRLERELLRDQIAKIEGEAPPKRGKKNKR